MRKIGLWVVALCCALAGCDDRGPVASPIKQPQPSAMQKPARDLEVIHQGDGYTNVSDSQKFQVIASKEQYEAALLSYPYLGLPHAVDFSAYKILLVDMGATSARYSVDTDSISAVANDHGVTVTVVEDAAGRGCVWPMAVTRPYLFLLISTTEDILVHQEQRLKHCQPDDKDLSQEARSEGDIKTIHEGTFGYAYQNGTKQIQVIGSRQQYEAALLSYPHLGRPLVVDFLKNKILLVDMGLRPTTGYFITLDSRRTLMQDGTLKVTLVYKFSGDNCVTGQASTNPFKFFQIPAIGRVLISEQIELLDCAVN